MTEAKLYSGALFGPDDRRFRYVLWRLWDREKPPLNVIGLNPSTADEHKDDPTIRRCIRFARDWGHGGLLMTNLFALRSTDPRALYADPRGAIGPQNDAWLKRVATAGLGVDEVAYLVPSGYLVPPSRVLAAWGNHGQLVDRGEHVIFLLRPVELDCLGQCASGQPKHPLYLRADAQPQPLRRHGD